MQKQSADILEIPIERVKPNPNNPRIIRDEKFLQLKKSLKEFPQMMVKRPLVLNSKQDMTVLGGNMRLKAITELGYKSIPEEWLTYADDWTEEQKKQFIIKDNVSYGEWNLDMLLNEWNVDELLDWGVDIDKKEPEIKEDDFNAAEYVSQIKEPISKRGDIYEFKEVGKDCKHRLICGDSTSEFDVTLLMQKEKARLIFTDPPYNVDYKSPAGLSYDSKKFGGSGKIINDNKSDEDCLQFYVSILKNLYNFSSDDSAIYWWFASKNVVINRTAWENTGWQFSQQIIWLKNSLTFSMGQDYHRIYEPCLFGWKKGKKHYKNKKLNNLRDCFHLDVADFKTIIDVWYEKRDTTNQYVHPTQKPLRLAERALKKSSKPGDNVVDFFGGSGSTMLSCHQMERNSFLCEIDPKFCDAIVRRFAKLMGESGKQFEISKNGKLINHTDYNVSH